MAVRCCTNRPSAAAVSRTPYDTSTLPRDAATSALMTWVVDVRSVLTVTGTLQCTPSLDDEARSNDRSLDDQTEYIRPSTGSIVAEGRQHRTPGTSPPTS